MKNNASANRTAPVFGVDISEMNGAVDFSALQKAGVKFVLIRCGYGNDDGDQDDIRFLENVRKADAAGMPWGAYLYSYALNVDMAQSEVRHMLRLLNGRKPAYGVWYDVEDTQQAGADLVKLCEVFCGAMEAEGLYAGIYSMLAWMETKLDSPRLDKYDKWVAQVYEKCEYTKPYGIWQYSHTGQIGGKEFDLNYAYRDYPALTGQKKEEPELTKAEVEKIVEAAVGRSIASLEARLNQRNPTYNTIEEVPGYWREELNRALELGLVRGTGKELGLTQTEVKGAVMALRAYEAGQGGQAHG